MRTVRIEPRSLAEIARLAGGEIVSTAGATVRSPGGGGRSRGDLSAETMIRTVSTDSRDSSHKGIFVALRGEHMDGHDYCARAVERGSKAVLVSREVQVPPGIIVIRTDDTSEALIRLGHGIRGLSRARVAAVTGTSGKTTTKELLAAIASRRHDTISTEGNLNNRIGVPLTLMRMREKTEIAVVEIATSAPGEIEELARIVDPDLGIITTIGPGHIEFFSSVKEILHEKAALIRYLNASGGTIVLDRDSEYFDELAPAATCRVISTGESPSADLSIRDPRLNGLEGSSFVYRGVRIDMRLVGLHAVRDAALAAAAAEALGIDPWDVREGLMGAFSAEGRGMVRRVGGVNILDDSYNANPVSFRAALEVLASSGEGRRIVVMSDMLELGESAIEYHAEVGGLIARAGAALLLWRGEATRAAARAAEKAGVETREASSNDELLAMIEEEASVGDTILVKASHGMGLSGVVEGLTEALVKRTAGEIRRLRS